MTKIVHYRLIMSPKKELSNNRWNLVKRLDKHQAGLNSEVCNHISGVYGLYTMHGFSVSFGVAWLDFHAETGCTAIALSCLICLNTHNSSARIVGIGH